MVKTRNVVILVVSVVLMLLVMLATPVGGWHPLNLHRNDYVMFFGISVMCVVVSLILCAFDKE